MKVEISDVGSTRKEMKVVVPRQEVDAVTNDIYRDISQKVTIRGFRKGKAPRHIIKMYYSDYIQSELSKKLIQDKFGAGCQEQDLSWSPCLISPTSPRRKTRTSLTAQFDVKPEVKLRSIPVFRPKPKTEINEANIQMCSPGCRKPMPPSMTSPTPSTG